MPYSTNLRIELIPTGQQAGLWGTTTNTNLGTILEDSIAGYELVPVASSAQAFTAVDGAADQARNAIIKLTTSTAGNFSVFAPPVSKQYIIWNASNYSATIYNSATLGNTTPAGNGVIVAPGDKVVVFSDGTDFSGLVGSKRVVTVASAASVTPNVATTDILQQQNTQPIGTLAVNAPTGTPSNGQTFVFRLNSTAVQTFAWDAIYQGSTDSPLPTASSGAGKTDYMGFIYNAVNNRWQMLAKNFGF